jgi:hypothetical protein
VAVGRHAVVRSHAFLAGSFSGYRVEWDGTLARSKLWYVPLVPGPMAPLRVTARSLDRPTTINQAVQWQSRAWGSTGDAFYATGTVLPHRGRWRLTATSGTNWGCFDFTL